jgi:Rrf2 family transcriptional regulator, iron-sulfur cluster assembly transcription factor
MRLSTRARYAVRAMIDLAANSAGGSVTRSEIAERQEISPLYLSHILLRLSKAGLVASAKGPGGGYLLARPADRISVGEIVSAAGEPTAPTRCVSKPSRTCEAGSCNLMDTCATHLLWQRLANTINDTLGSVSLADLCADARLLQQSCLVLEA